MRADEEAQGAAIETPDPVKLRLVEDPTDKPRCQVLVADKVCDVVCGTPECVEGLRRELGGIGATDNGSV